MSHFTQSSTHTSLKMTKYLTYLEAGLPESIKHSNLMNSVLSKLSSGFSNLSALEMKGIGGLSRTAGYKSA
jgi:hypothetical protein